MEHARTKIKKKDNKTSLGCMYVLYVCITLSLMLITRKDAAFYIRDGVKAR